MTSSLEWVGLVTAALSAVHALGVVRRRPWRRLDRRAPGAGVDHGVKRELCGCPVARVVRFEAADGSVLTVWTVRPGAGGRREESGLW
ncbi:hypothetical protein AB0J57_00445 [Streptomyces sp. NPDC049837]|uniref:hypothetical protein n=1 Tax=Streptomyces sp. NPDC049837 TaxID=3155277 RepID=UPI00341213B7